MKAQISQARFKIEEQFERALIAARGEATGAFLEEPFKQRMEACMARLRETSERYSQVDKVCRSKAQRRQQALDRMRRTLRDYVNVLRRRANRENAPELIGHFTLPKKLDGEKVPWTAYAEKLLEGANLAEANGIPPVTNPDSAELAERLDEVRAIQTELDGLLNELGEARKQNQDAESDCTFRLRELRLKVHEATQAKAPVVQRQLLRTYGFGVNARRTAKDDLPAPPARGEEVTDPFLAPSLS